jgi:hypothetical protein
VDEMDGVRYIEEAEGDRRERMMNNGWQLDHRAMLTDNVSEVQVMSKLSNVRRGLNLTHNDRPESHQAYSETQAW